MAILRIAISDLDQESYARLVDALQIATDHPLGVIMHGATEVNGTMAIAQVCDSAEYGPDPLGSRHLSRERGDHLRADRPRHPLTPTRP